MLHREIPFLRICVPLVCGIVAALHFRPGIIFFIASGLLTAILFLFSFSYNLRRYNYLFGAGLFISFFLLGILLYTYEKKSLSELAPEPGIFVCTLSDYPQEKSQTLMLRVKLHQEVSSSGTRKVKGSMIVYHRDKDKQGNFIPGDRLIIKCTPAEITNRGNPFEFNYRFYMENLGIKYYAFTSKSSIIVHDKGHGIKLAHRALIVRKRIIEMYGERGISEERLPLVAALTLGEKSSLDPEQKQNFIKAGVMHIMAVSGLHAVILSLFIMNLLFFLKRRFNLLRILIVIIFLWAFAFVTGLTPSVMRATVMFTFIQAGNLMQRRVNGINSVLASAFVLILAHPSIIFDSGFLLSYAAVIFIIAFYNNIQRLLSPGNRITSWLWQSAVVTIVAQAGTLPFTVTMFNRFPVWFILTNIIIVPLSSLAIILGCLIPLFYPVKLISGILGSALDKLTWLTEFLTAKAAGLPFAGITGIGMTIIGCLLFFSVLYAFFYHITSKTRYSLQILLALSLMLATYSTINSVMTRTSNELVIYNISGSKTVGIRTGRVLHIYSDNSDILTQSQEISRHKSAAGLKVTYTGISSGSVFLNAGGNEIAITDPPGVKWLTGDPEIIVISGFRSNDRKIPWHYHGRIVVISGAQPFTFSDGQVPLVHYIKESGAFRARL